MVKDPKIEIIGCACSAISAMRRGRDIDAKLLQSMVWNKAEIACRNRGATPAGRPRYESDVRDVIRKLEERGILRKQERGHWVLLKNIEGQVRQLVEDIS